MKSFHASGISNSVPSSFVMFSSVSSFFEPFTSVKKYGVIFSLCSSSNFLRSKTSLLSNCSLCAANCLSFSLIRFWSGGVACFRTFISLFRLFQKPVVILKLKFCCFRQDSRKTQQSVSKKNSAPHVRLRDSSQSVPGKSLSLSSRFTFSSSRLACNALFSGSPVSVQ